MGNLSTVLQRTLTEKGLKQKDVQQRHESKTGKNNLGVSKLSRLISGSQTEVTSEDLDDLMDAITKKPEERAEIISARLYDAYNGSYRENIVISVTGGSPKTKRMRFTPHGVAPSPAVMDALDKLAAMSIERPATATIILALAHGLDPKKK